MFGLMLYGLGVTLCIKANIGYSPWDVFHAGISKYIHQPVGNASIYVGIIICIITYWLGEKMGFGTLMNTIFIGVFTNIFMKILPVVKNGYFFIGLLIMIVGLFVISFGSYFYINSAFGAGPRDSLMVVIRRKTNLPVGISRGIVEGIALLIGFLLGGMVGLGTAISMIMVSVCVQFVFYILKFDPTKITHETLKDTYYNLYKKDIKK